MVFYLIKTIVAQFNIKLYLIHGKKIYLSKYLKTFEGRQFTFCNFISVTSKIMIR